MEERNEFDVSINLTKNAFLLSGMGFGVSMKIDYLVMFIYYFNLLWLYTDVEGELHWLIEGIRLGKSLDELSMVAPCSTICLLSTAKTIPIVLNKVTLKSAVEKLRSLHPNQFENNFEREMVEESTKLLKSAVFFLYASCVAVVLIFSSLPLMLMGYDYYYTGETDFKLPFLIKYFFDAYANMNVWLFMYIHQVWSSLIVCLNIFSVDTLFYAFCTFLRMHFRILGHNFENLICDTDNETRQKMRECLRRHQELIVLVDQMEILYSKSNLFNILSSSLLICLSGFNIVLVDDMSATLAFIPFLIVSLTQISMMCFFGDMLMASSTRIGDAIYNSRWYDAPPDIKKSLLFSFLRARTPCKVTAANFAVLNLNAFMTILSRSWSYFALLRTMYN